MNLPTPTLRIIIAYANVRFRFCFHVRRKGWLSTTYPRVLYFMALASNSKRKGGCCCSDSAFILLQRLQVSPLTVVIRFSVLVVLTPIIIVVVLFYRTQRVKIQLGGGISTFFINFQSKSLIGPAE